MKTPTLVILALLAALAFPFLLPAPSPSGQGSDDPALVPWHITLTEAGESRVFGLTPGHSTLGEAQARFATAPEIAIIGLRTEPGSLEAFFDGVRLNALTGKIVITVDATSETLLAMRQRAVKTEHMDSAMLRSTLTPDDLDLARRMPVRAIIFVPAARLDESVVTERFGPPAQRVDAEGGVLHLLYPALGLDVALNARGRTQLQYVAPRDFARLHAPLLRSTPQRPSP